MPLTPITIDILLDYNYIFNPPFYIGEYRKNIKSILKRFSKEMPSLSEKRQIRYNVNNEEYINTVPRYMRFGSHSGRRTCITNLINMGVPDGEGMKISGHSDISIYRGYYDSWPNGNNENFLQKLYNSEIV